MNEPGVSSAWEGLVRVHRALTTTMDASLSERFDRSLDDYDVLHQLHVAGDPLRMGGLAERLLVANSSCHRLVGRLVDAGLVERRVGPQDRREVLVGLTAAGRRLYRSMAAVHGRDIQRLFGGRLTAGERVTMEQAFSRLLDDRSPAAGS